VRDERPTWALAAAVLVLTALPGLSVLWTVVDARIALLPPVGDPTNEAVRAFVRSGDLLVRAAAYWTAIAVATTSVRPAPVRIPLFAAAGAWWVLDVLAVIGVFNVYGLFDDLAPVVYFQF
jgi:hypothetical protein